MKEPIELTPEDMANRILRRDQLIMSIPVNKGNFQHIIETGKINGSLYDSISNLLITETHLAFKAGAEYATEYEREQAILSCEYENESIRKFIAHEAKEIPKLQDFASGSGDAEGYARLCGQLTLLERIKAALNSKSQ